MARKRLRKGDLKVGQRKRVKRGIEARGVVPSIENPDGIVYGVRYMHQGREIRKDVGPNISDAEAALITDKADIFRGTYQFRTRRHNPAFTEFTPIFLDWVRTHKSSHALDEQLLKPLSAFFGKWRLGGIQKRDIEDYKPWRLKQGVRPRTVNLELWCAQQIFDLAIGRGTAVRTNPVRGVKRLKVRKRRYHIVTDDEEARLIGAAPAWLRDFYILTIDAGLRLSEACALKSLDYDAGERSIRVYQTKTDEFKTIPLTDRAREVVERGIARGSETLLVNDEGGRIVHIHGSWYRLLKRAGLKGLRIHDLRHTFATRLARAGTDVRTLMDLGGWESVEIAVEYIESSPRAKREAIERLSNRTRDSNGPAKENGSPDDPVTR